MRIGNSYGSIMQIGNCHGSLIQIGSNHGSLTLWHIPHGIVLRATIKNNNNSHLLFEQPSSRHSHATSCASFSLASSSHDFHTVTKSLHSEHFYAINQLLAKNSISINQRTSPKGASISSRVLYLSPTFKGTNSLRPALLHVSIHDALLTTHVLLPSHRSGTLITNASSSHTHHSELQKFLLKKWNFGYKQH